MAAQSNHVMDPNEDEPDFEHPLDQISSKLSCVPVEERVDKKSNFSGRIYLPPSVLLEVLRITGDGKA